MADHTAQRLGAEISWANTRDRTARTQAARDAMQQKFLDMADGDPVRAAHFRKAFYHRLAMASAKARTQPKIDAAKAQADAELDALAAAEEES